MAVQVVFLVLQSKTHTHIHTHPMVFSKEPAQKVVKWQQRDSKQTGRRAQTELESSNLREGQHGHGTGFESSRPPSWGLLYTLTAQFQLQSTMRANIN